MAIANSTLDNASKTILSGGSVHDGANACMVALKRGEEIASKGEADFFEIQDAVMNEIMAAAGNRSDYLSGFIAVLAEFVTSDLMGGTPNLEKWKPEAGMTADEIAAVRSEAYLEDLQLE